mmetsp:Transcript_12154/g.44357  ORF Transcript_12154/g.44357 Transcript_12154/m.44357 type:complete len:209 (-) Transcript_12154:342-968(-)
MLLQPLQKQSVLLIAPHATPEAAEVSLRGIICARRSWRINRVVRRYRCSFLHIGIVGRGRRSRLLCVFFDRAPSSTALCFWRLRLGCLRFLGRGGAHINGLLHGCRDGFGCTIDGRISIARGLNGEGERNLCHGGGSTRGLVGRLLWSRWVSRHAQIIVVLRAGHRRRGRGLGKLGRRVACTAPAARGRRDAVGDAVEFGEALGFCKG